MSLKIEELQAIDNLLSRQGFKVDITEVEAVSQIRGRVKQELQLAFIEAQEAKTAQAAVTKTLAESKKPEAPASEEVTAPKSAKKHGTK